MLAQLNEQTQQSLSGMQIPSPETFLKNRREEIRELEQNAVYLSSKLDLAQKQRQSSKLSFCGTSSNTSSKSRRRK